MPRPSIPGTRPRTRRPWRPLALALLATALAFGQAPGPAPEIVLLGTVHDMHMKPGMHFSLGDLRRQIEAIGPDLICLEIEPEAFDGPMEGYFPPEAAFIAAIAPDLHARVAPTDWRIAKAWQDRAEAQVPAAVRSEIDAIGQKTLKELQAAAAAQGLYEFLHGPFLAQVDHMFFEVAGDNTPADIAGGAWIERNRRVIEHTLDAAPGARRILIVYGAAHLPQLARELRQRGLASLVAPRRFQPGGIAPVPPAVLARWRRNLENLKGIRDGRIRVSRDNAEKVKASKRIENLEEALAVYGPPRP